MVGMNTGLEGTRRLHDTAQFSKHMLPNGVTVWIQQSTVQLDKSIHILAFFPNVGAQYDPQNKKGLAHFFEHMPFRGTQNKPSEELLSWPIEERGGELNANTNLIRTYYEVFNLPQQDLELALETLAEFSMRSLLRPEDIQKEAKVIADNEYPKAMANPEIVLNDLLVKETYKGHPRDNNVLGEPDVIRSITAEELQDFQKTHYHATNLHLLLTGNLPDTGITLWLVDKYFGGFCSGDPTPNPRLQLPIGKSGTIRIFEPRCVNDTFALLYPMHSSWDEDLLRFFANVLSRGTASPLWIELREKRGLSYSEGQCTAGSYPDLKGFSAVFSTPSVNFSLFEHIYREALTHLSPAYVIRRQKERQYRRQTESQHPTGICYRAIYEIVNFGRPSSYWEDEEHEDQLTLEEVFKLRDYLLNAEPLRLEITTK